MRKKPNLKQVHVLLADSDHGLSQAVISCLRAMGFVNIVHVKTYDAAVRALVTQPTSFLITEWQLEGGSGIDLIRYIRRDNKSPDRALPIVMLTGKGEMPDVEMARDSGITEFVVKPFSAQTLYMRLEQIIDHPRDFVYCDAYVGPERRRRGLPPPGVSERRVAEPVKAVVSRDALKLAPGKAPIIFTPDDSLRKQAGLGRSLSSLLTPDVLEDAQRAIDALGEESLQWIREDLSVMERNFESLQRLYSAYAIEQLKAVSLSVKSRAGTFGYRMASDVARLLYLFLITDFSPTKPRHVVVIQKHLEVLKVIFAQNIREREGVGAELYVELERLVASHR